jgi:hypothetical protein
MMVTKKPISKKEPKLSPVDANKPWRKALINFASAALHAEELRLRVLYSQSAEVIDKTPALSTLSEKEIVGVIYAAIATRLPGVKAISRETPYPKKPGRSKDPRQFADLCIEESGRGKNPAYIEVKKYSNGRGKRGFENDARKLGDIPIKTQRLILFYRFETPGQDTKRQSLLELIEKNDKDFIGRFRIKNMPFDAVSRSGELTKFELALVVIKAS